MVLYLIVSAVCILNAKLVDSQARKLLSDVKDNSDWSQKTLLKTLLIPFEHSVYTKYLINTLLACIYKRSVHIQAIRLKNKVICVLQNSHQKEYVPMLHPTELTEIGLIYLKSAVLNVLAAEPDLKPTKISERIGIPKSNIGMSYPIVRGLLEQLKIEGRVVESHDRKHPPWRLTENERTVRTTG